MSNDSPINAFKIPLEGTKLFCLPLFELLCKEYFERSIPSRFFQAISPQRSIYERLVILPTDVQTSLRETHLPVSFQLFLYKDPSGQTLTEFSRKECFERSIPVYLPLVICPLKSLWERLAVLSSAVRTSLRRSLYEKPVTLFIVMLKLIREECFGRNPSLPLFFALNQQERTKVDSNGL